MSPDTVIMTVNGDEVKAPFYFFQAARYLAAYDEIVGGTSDRSWIDTYNDELTEYIRRTVVSSETINQKAEEAGIVLSEDELTQIDETVQSNIDSAGDQETFEKMLMQNYCIDEDTYRSILQTQALASKIEDYYFGDGGQTPVTDETVADYIQENGVYQVKYILLSNTEYSDEEAVATGNDLIAQLQAADDADALMDDLIDEYSYDTGSSGDGTIFKSGECVSEFEEAAMNLEIGSFTTELVYNTDYGYFIIERLAVDTESYRDTVKEELYSDLLESWIDEAEVVTSEEYDSVSLIDFYTNLKGLSASTQTIS